MVSALCTRGGYTPAEADAMCLPEARMLTDFWRNTPPLRDIVSAFAGAFGVQVERAIGPPAAQEVIPEPPEFEE